MKNNITISEENNGLRNTGFEDFITPDHVIKILNSTKEKDLQRCNSLPLKVTMTNNNTILSQNAMKSSNKDMCRQSLRQALKKDPIGRLHQVHDRNLVNLGQSDIGHHLRRRRESARRIREKIISNGGESRRQSTVSDTSVSHDSKLENLMPGERTEVNILLEKHLQLRRKKSTNGSKRDAGSRTLVHQNSFTPSISEMDEDCTDL